MAGIRRCHQGRTAKTTTAHIRWTIDGDAPVVGVGFEVGALWVFGYPFVGRPGVIVYERDGETLKGRWTVGGAETTWSETLTRAPANHPPPPPTPQRDTPKPSAGTVRQL